MIRRYRVSLAVIFLIAWQSHGFMMKISNNVCTRKNNIRHSFTEGNVQTVSDTYENLELEKISNISALDGIILVSLPPLSDDAPRIVRDVWKWKDIVLGDGRDYFIPRPRALKALSGLIINTPTANVKIKECAILSNCARLDILVSLDFGQSKINSGQEEIDVKKIISAVVSSQLEVFQSKKTERNAFIEGVSSLLDLPGMVDETIDISVEVTTELESLLEIKSEVDDILRHFSFVAAGLAQRASRPDRDVVFRPFSSRDAHIMLQLKRTAEVSKEFPTMKTIFDTALSSGKGARNPKECPSLNKLKGYDGEGKYSQAAPLGLAREVADDVVDLIIEPQVQKGIQRLRANAAASSITYLRSQAELLYNPDDKDSAKIVNRLLHEPTMKLRDGVDVDVAKIISSIQEELTSKNKPYSS